MKQGMLALVANDPPVYRQVIADALGRLRPLVQVIRVEPEELDEAVGRLQPHLVICDSRATEAVRRAGCLLSWVVLYPDGEDRAEVWTCGGGEEAAARRLSGVQVADLLSVVDETELLCRSA